MAIKTTEKCKGCYDYDPICWVQSHADCPCQTCLVKGMCHDACESFHSFEYKEIEQRDKGDCK